MSKCGCGAAIMDGTCGSCWPGECTCQTIPYRHIVQQINMLFEERAVKAAIKRGNIKQVKNHVIDKLAYLWFEEG